MTDERLFGTNGIRGVVNEVMTPDFAVKMGEAIGTFFEGKKIFVGCDGRTSNQMLSKAVIVGLMSTGCTVYYIGLAPTPAVQYAVKYFGADGAIIVTASHNPPQYNGIKVVDSSGVEIFEEKEKKIEEIYRSQKFNLVSWDKLGRVIRYPDVLEVYKEGVKKQVDVEAISKAKFKVVVDPANGVGALVIPYLLRELGCEVRTINAQIDGSFPGRLSEPRIERLKDLSDNVKSTGANLGVALDGDADRSIFVDEKGTAHWGEKTGAVFAEYIVKRNPRAVVVTPISSSKLIEDIVKKHNGKLVWTKVGSTTVTRVMLKEKGTISFEDNGGVFYGPHQAVRDSAMATALMLEVLAKTGKSLSQLIAELPEYHIVKTNIECPDNLKTKVLALVLQKTKECERLTIDGIKVFRGEASVLIRPSGTEPIFRVYSEGRTREAAEELANWGIKLVKSALSEVK
jgi:phosphomannomutase/phosphoglucomutase